MEEGDDLSAGAGIAGIEDVPGKAVGDTGFHGPGHGGGIVRVGGHVGEGGGVRCRRRTEIPIPAYQR